MSIGAIIPCRTQASRLPGKPLLDVAGKTSLERVAGRARCSARVGRIVIATTADAADDHLADFAESCGLGVYRGSTDDVLQRITAAAVNAGFDTVVEIDGDDLMCAPEYMNRGIDVLADCNADYVSFTGLPLGATPSILRTTALEKAVSAKQTSDTSTGFFRFLTESGLFRVVKLAAENPAHHHPTARLTLDYPQDLDFFRAVYRELDQIEGGWEFADLVKLLNRRPELAALNQGLDEVYWSHFASGVSANSGQGRE